MSENSEKNLNTTLVGQLGRVLKAVDGATVALGKSVKETTEQIDTNLTVIEQQEETIAGKEAALEALEVDFEETQRQLKAGLKVWETEAELTTAETIANSHGRVVVKTDDWYDLEELKSQHAADIAKIKKEGEAAIQRAVGAKETAMKLEHKAENATQTAELDTIKRELATANATIVDLKDQITAEREARISIETSRSAPVVNVSGK